MGTLRGIEVFALVVRCGSFSEAARQLDISKSSVSKIVAQLEDVLGMQLLERTTRRMALTEAGAAFYPGCERILGEAARATLAARCASAELAGRLRVRVPAPLEALHLAPLIPEFLRRHPGVQVETARTRALAGSGDADFDVELRVGGAPEPCCGTRPVAMNSLVVCAAPEYLRRAGAPRVPGDLADHACVHYRELFPAHAWEFAGADGERVAVPVRPVFASESGEAVREALVAGTGLGFVPTFLVGADLKAGRLRTVLGDHVDAPSPIHAVFPYAREQAAVVHAFVDHLHDVFQPRPGWEPRELEATAWREA